MMTTQPQKTSTRYIGARIIRRSERCSNTAIKTGNIMLRDAPDPANSTMQICDLTKMFPPYHTEEEARQDNMLISLTNVKAFAKHYNSNIMYWTLFGISKPKDFIELKVSCISQGESPMTDFAVGIVPSAYRHTKQPFVSLLLVVAPLVCFFLPTRPSPTKIATCQGSVFLSSAGFLECTSRGTAPISPLYVHPYTNEILQCLRFCNENNSPDLRIERSNNVYSFIANNVVLYRVRAPASIKSYDVFVDMRCDRIQGMWASKPPLVNVNFDDVLRHNQKLNTVSVRSEGSSTAARECLMLSKANDYARKTMGRTDLVPRIIGAGVYNYVEAVACGSPRSPGRQHVLVTEYVQGSTPAYSVSLSEPWMWRRLLLELVQCMVLFIGSQIVHNDFYARNLLIRMDRKKKILKCTVIDFEKAVTEKNEAALLFNNYCCLVGMVVNLVYRNWKHQSVQPILADLLRIVGHGLLLMYETERGDIVPNWTYLKEWGQDTRQPNQSMDDYFRVKLQGTNVTVRRRVFENGNQTFLVAVLVKLHHYASSLPSV